MRCVKPQMPRAGTLVLFLAVLAVFYTGCASKSERARTAVSSAWTADGSLEASSQVQPASEITGIETSEDRESASVSITGDGLLTYTSVKQPSPPAVLLYFPKTALSNFEESHSPGGDTIDRIRVSELPGEPTTAKIEIALLGDRPYSVTREDLGVRISFQKAGTPWPPEAAAYPEDLDAAPEEDVEQPIADAIGAGAPEASWLQAVYATRFDDGVEVTIEADGAITDYDSFPVEDPARIVLDIPGLNSSHEEAQTVPVNTQWVKQIRHYGYPGRVRIVLDTEDAYLSSYRASPIETGLVVYIGEGSLAARPDRVEEQPAMVAEVIPEEIEAGAFEAAYEPGPEGSTLVEKIHFISEEAGQSTVMIGTTRPIEYELQKPTDTSLMLLMYNAHLPGYRYREDPLITTRFDSAVDRITPIRRKGTDTASRLLIELREAVPYFVEQQENFLMVHFEASGVPPRPMDEADMPPWKRSLARAHVTEAEVREVTEVPEVRQAPESAAPPPVSEGPPPAAKGPPAAQAVQEISLPAQKYTGSRIALDFFETDIRNVFRVLRKISGKNFAVDKDVTGKVTLSLGKPVPWDQVLDLVLRMNGLGKVYEGDIIRIARIETLRKHEADRQIELAEQAKAREQRSAVEPLVTEYIPVNYSKASELVAHLEKIATKERGSISVDERSNLIIITDVAEKVRRAKEIVQVLDEPTRQVIIQARIVEANTNFSRELGTQWGLQGGIANTDPRAGVGPQRGFETLGGTYGYVASVDFPGNINPASSGLLGFNFARITGTPLLLEASLEAMESRGDGKIISAPKILTLDNKKASIKQGLEYPYLERDDAGGATVRFKEIDLLLEVTPHVTDDDRVSMLVHITKNDLGSVIQNQQSFTTKEAETELLVDDGETIVIGGIIKTIENTSETGLPGLSSLPVFGWLFKTNKNEKVKEELLIFITPKIVKLEQRELL